MTLKKWLTLMLCALMLLTALPALGEAAPDVTPEAAEEAAPEETAEAEEVPADAPQHFFAQMELTYMDGTPFDTSVFLGKPLFLNIWATWCGPCLSEMPHLQELSLEYADKINIVGMHSEGMTVSPEGQLVPNDDRNQDGLDIMEEMGLTYPLLNPDVTMFILMTDPQYGLQVSAVPSTWFIDSDGIIRDVVRGSKDKEGWKDIIDAFLEYLENEQEQADAADGN